MWNVKDFQCTQYPQQKKVSNQSISTLDFTVKSCVDLTIDPFILITERAAGTGREPNRNPPYVHAMQGIESGNLVLNDHAGNSVRAGNSTPPALVSEGLALFDAEVCRHFCDCSAIDTSDSEWLQVQLSLSRGGVSLCRLALHCSAAYLASVNKAGSPYKLSPYSIAWFHLQVPTLKCLYWNPVQVKKTYRPEVMTINLTSYASSPPWPTVFIYYSSHRVMLPPG